MKATPKEAPRKGFQFVDVLPELEGNVEKRNERKKLVRSNAAKYQWDRERSKGKKVKPSKERLKATELEQDEEVVKVLNDVDERKMVICGDATMEHIWDLIRPEDERLGKLIRFNAEITIPNLLPPIGPGIAHPSTIKWLTQAMSNRKLFMIWSHCAAVHYNALLPDSRPIIPTSYLANHGKVLRLLNEEMKNPDTAATDENILAVSGIAKYNWAERPSGPKKRVNQGPLRGLQGLGVFSSMPSVPGHRMGLAMLVELRGGIDKIEPGLAALMSYCDIIEATCHLSPPQYPFKSLFDKPFTPDNGLAKAAGRPPSLRSLGHGFPPHWQHSSTPSLRSLSTVLRLLCNYTIVIHEHIEGIAFQKSPALLANQRNFTQHSLVSLPHHPRPEPGPGPIEDVLYESTRLATYIYALLITFPFSANMAPFEELAALLRNEVSVLNTLDLCIEDSKLLVWVLVMGGIAAVDTLERIWFVSMLREVVGAVDIGSWEEMRDLLGGFLWLGSANDVDGRVLWEEVEACVRGGCI